MGTKTAFTALLLLGCSGVALAAPKAPPKRKLQILSTPPGATVYLGTVDTPPIGKTPLKNFAVVEGFTDFHFVLEGHRSEKVSVQVDRSTKKVEASLLRLAKLVLRGANEASNGASVIVNGAAFGQIPAEKELEPGRLLVEVKKPGFNPYSQWIEVKGGEILSLQVALVAEAQPVGTVFVTSDVSGAVILVDGVERARTPASIELAPGPALFEIRAPNLPAWKTTVQVEAGKKAIVEAKVRPEAAPRGTALILSNVPGTLISVDGVKTGTAPVTRNDLLSGTHIVEAFADGFQPAQAVLQIKEGEQSVLKMDLKPVEAEYGRVSVRASVPGAEVFVDGGAKGAAPVELDQVPLGNHSIVVRAKSHLDFESTCEVKRNQLCSVMAELTPMATIVVTADAPDARLLIDGKQMGPLPFEGTVTAGPHQFRVEAKDRIATEQAVTLQPTAEPRALNFILEKPGATVEPMAEGYYLGSSAYSGVPLGPGYNTLDVNVGVPYLLEARGMLGLLDKLAVGVALRILERDKSLGVAELALRAHTGFRPLTALSLGATAEGWAGTNFGSSNSFGGTLTLLGTLHFRDKASFSLGVSGDLIRDNWENEPTISATEPTGNDVAARMRINGTVLLWMTEKMALSATLDGKVAGDDRLMYRENWFGLVKNDPRIYFRVGATWSF
jgi:hypothetical protein